MRDPWWDVTEEEWVARWGSSGMVPELLAWWRKEKARRDARTPEEVAAEENALAQQRAQEAVWEAEARAAQVERHEDKERTEKLIARICPSQDRGQESRVGSWLDVRLQSESEAKRILEAIRVARDSAGSHIAEYRRREALLDGLGWAVGLLTGVLVVRALPHWAPIAIALVVATALGYWAGTGCTLALKRAGWRKPDPADMIELATGENLYDTHHRLVHAQIWIEHGLAQRQHRSLGSS